VLRYLRDFLDSMDFLEVETPMLQTIPGGAAARPFKTHHNALDMDMYLRIAPELYLKRLVVGGFERVYEINRNFRNEGVSTRHNPEFTMLELYVAYADYNDLMIMVERAMQGLADVVAGSRQISYQGRSYDLNLAFTRITVEEAVAKHTPGFDVSRARDVAYLRETLTRHGIAFKPGDGAGKLQIELFEKFAEHEFMDPTFVHAYPTEVSPLSRMNDRDPFLTDRFEFFLAGREIANGFSELNDAEDQAARFRAQVERKEAGDDEAMYYDADYVRALEYGMPPTAGLGVGIDRLVMFFTDSPSIRDVLLFPHMRPESS
jgi:lysyl-tRNA synthetase class 2